MIIDVKNLFFSKHYNLTTKCNLEDVIGKTADGMRTQYLSFGYFDYVEIINMKIPDETNILTKIDSITTEVFKNVLDGFFFYPISCFATDDILTQEEVTCFWNENLKSAFLCMAFISAKDKIGTDMHSIFEKCQKEIVNSPHLIYKTANATEAVIFIHSNNLCEVFESLQELSKIDTISCENIVININLKADKIELMDKDKHYINIDIISDDHDNIKKFVTFINDGLGYKLIKRSPVFAGNGCYSINQDVVLSSQLLYDYATLLNNCRDTTQGYILNINTKINCATIDNAKNDNKELKGKYSTLKKDMILLFYGSLIVYLG